MAKRMTDDELLALLVQKERDASDYIHGELGDQREKALRAYHRLPYGNEEEGLSQVISSDVQDTVEWILPALLKVFTSTDKAVSFEPSTAADVQATEQATDACNYVFYRQNSGFLVLYEAFKDALTVKNGCVMWRKCDKETISSTPFRGATLEVLTSMLEEADTELAEADSSPALDPNGMPVLDQMGIPIMLYSGRIKKVERKKYIKVEAFSPENLLVDRDWHSPILEDCPYVARLVPVTLSDLKLMGHKDVTAADLGASDRSDMTGTSTDRLTNVDRRYDDESITNRDYYGDESMASGWLRIEYVLIDMDGDGIAERMEIHRLEGKILSMEPCGHVPIATWSPLLNAHRWDGMSIADLAYDLQLLHTELLRQTLDNLYLTNTPRTKVLTDANWSPLVNMDDLTDPRAGGIIRVRDPNAVTEQVIPFTAGASMPMLDYVQEMRENRTGVSRTSMGLNPDSLNNTATGRQIDQSAAYQRVELIARVAAEMLVKPMFEGILKLLTEGDMDKMVFRLRDEFVEYDPNEWRDNYDMTIHVGLGTGDRIAQGQSLAALWQMQQAAMQYGIATNKHLYNTAVKTVENAGFKDVQSFVQDPSKQPPQPPAPPPLPILLEQMKQQADAQKTQAQLQADAQKFQAQTTQSLELERLKAQAKLQEVQANLELQAANDARDSERERMKAELDAALQAQRLEFDKWKAELDARVKMRIAQIGTEQTGDELLQQVGDAFVMQEPSPIDKLAAMHAETMNMMALMAQNMAKPKQIIRDANGRAQGVA